MSNHPNKAPAHLVAFGRKYAKTIVENGWVCGTDNHGSVDRLLVYEGSAAPATSQKLLFKTNDKYALRVWMDVNGLMIDKGFVMDMGWKIGLGNERLSMKKVNLAYRNDLPC